MQKIKTKNIKEQIELNEQCFIVITTTWCGECIMLKKVIEQLEKEGFKIPFLEINADEENLWALNNSEIVVTSVPVIYYFVKTKQQFIEKGFKEINFFRKLFENV